MLYTPFLENHSHRLEKIIYHCLHFSSNQPVNDENLDLLLNRFYIDDKGNLSTMINLYGKLFHFTLSYNILNDLERKEFQAIISTSKALKEVTALLLEPTHENPHYCIIIEYGGIPFFSESFTLPEIKEKSILFVCPNATLEKALFPNETNEGNIIFDFGYFDGIRKEVLINVFHSSDLSLENGLFVGSLKLSL